MWFPQTLRKPAIYIAAIMYATGKRHYYLGA
jgi:hypothetical protein